MPVGRALLPICRGQAALSARFISSFLPLMGGILFEVKTVNNTY
jgi:hypothetical protein